MKKIWKIRKDEEGVSPVIATILMVAITVVLAAVLYVMVIGFGPTNKPASAGTWNEMKALSQTSGRAKFGQFTGVMEPINAKIFVQANGTDVGSITWGSSTDPGTVKWDSAPIGASVTYRDYNPSNGEINSGDYIELIGLNPGTKYSFEIFNIYTDSIINMGGDSDFNTPS